MKPQCPKYRPPRCKRGQRITTKTLRNGCKKPICVNGKPTIPAPPKPEKEMESKKCMRPATLICTSQVGRQQRLDGNVVDSENHGVVMAVAPSKKSIWIIAGTSPEQQLNCFGSRPGNDHGLGHSNFYGNALCKKYAKGFALEMGSSFKGNSAGLVAGHGRYLKKCRYEKVKDWVKPAECKKCFVYLKKHQGGKYYDCNDNGRARAAGNSQECIDEVLRKPNPFGNGKKVIIRRNWGPDGGCK